MANKKGQIQILQNPIILASIVGAILGYLIAPSIGYDRTIGIVVGGVLGFFASRFI